MRILGIASTSHGFGFAVTEQSGKLVDWGHRKTTASKAKMTEALDTLLRRGRPLFVASDVLAAGKSGKRAESFNEALVGACAAHGIMVLRIERKELKAIAEKEKPTKRDIAKAVAARFRELAPRLPKPREVWQSEDERMGLFLATAHTLAAWARFRTPR